MPPKSNPFAPFHTYGTCPVCRVNDGELCVTVDTKNSVVLDPEDFSKWAHGARVKSAQKLEYLFKWAHEQGLKIQDEFFVLSTTVCPVSNCKAELEKECVLICGGKEGYAKTDMRLHKARVNLVIKSHGPR